MSLVALINSSREERPESQVFAGVQTREDGVEVYLTKNPNLKASAQKIGEMLRSEFCDASLNIGLDTDPDDGVQTIVFEVKVPNLTVERRREFYSLTAGKVSDEESDSFVFVINRA